MNIKHRLQQYSRLNNQCNALRERILTLRDRMYSLRSSADTSEIQANSGNTDKIGANVALLTDLEEIYFNDLNKLLKEQKEIEDMIKDLEPLEKLLIRSRYVDGETWESICNIIGYSWAQTHRIHSNILVKLSSKYDTP